MHACVFVRLHVCVCGEGAVCGETVNMPVCLYTMFLCESLALRWRESSGCYETERKKGRGVVGGPLCLHSVFSTCLCPSLCSTFNLCCSLFITFHNPLYEHLYFTLCETEDRKDLISWLPYWTEHRIKSKCLNMIRSRTHSSYISHECKLSLSFSSLSPPSTSFFPLSTSDIKWFFFFLACPQFVSRLPPPRSFVVPWRTPQLREKCLFI